MDVDDCGLLAGDCIIICCCCPYLVVEVAIFIVLRLPWKLAQTTRRLVVKRLRRLEKNEIDSSGERVEMVVREERLGDDVWNELVGGQSYNGEWSPFLEAENVWDELLVGQGMFWFGSFWGAVG